MTILVFGSLNIDLCTRVTALPRPGETVLCPGYTLVAGGKGGNQALAAARAGAAVRMVGCVGRDGFAAEALRHLWAAAVDLTGVQELDAPTGCATVCVDAGGNNAIVVAAGANRCADAAQVLDAWLGPRTWVVLQMEVPHDQSFAVALRAQQRGARVVLNAAPAGEVAPNVLDAVDVLVVNEGEADTVARAAGLTTETPMATAAALAERHDLLAVVTLGSAGAVAVRGDQRLRAAPLTVDTVDTTAAGDTFVGYLAASLAVGAALPDALQLATTAAALCCTQHGAQPSIPTLPRTQQRLSHCPTPVHAS